MKKFLQSTLVLTLGLLVSVSCNSKKEEATTPQNEKIKVTIEQVHTEEVEQLYEYTAVVQAEAVNNIAPTIAGRIQKIYVEVGDYVTKRQKLVSMDASNLEQAKTQLDNLEVSFKRLDELYKVGGVSKSDWDANRASHMRLTRASYSQSRRKSRHD